ncbi:MAG: hypothetical protein WBA89_04835 [Microcoleus sp.]|uniref:hypothetical protein n=1 Tax=Microcoleus sp. TaxID=44472 RepID=UPI003C72B71B
MYLSSAVYIYNFTTVVFATCDRIHRYVVTSIPLDSAQMVSESSQNLYVAKLNTAELQDSAVL